MITKLGKGENGIWVYYLVDFEIYTICHKPTYELTKKNIKTKGRFITTVHTVKRSLKTFLADRNLEGFYRVNHKPICDYFLNQLIQNN